MRRHPDTLLAAHATWAPMPAALAEVVSLQPRLYEFAAHHRAAVSIHSAGAQF
ncbi:hypothetical protein SynBIOSE41_01223 [Synechococcus sp. BIOS-E4-1]|uniref:hypothetical protein n=1 Tax=Synechococcus sp. BIOS-E4-1 TaxID=1400864 RepID=UPI001645F8BA|nr:hypothetical protein [Synechococcus sp. BIOS-E4-1]QNI53744.1 hypothetical protein SynBIOSE41_01223 [Synechococcus sp. BIOS-E4-1]